MQFGLIALGPAGGIATLSRVAFGVVILFLAVPVLRAMRCGPCGRADPSPRTRQTSTRCGNATLEARSPGTSTPGPRSLDGYETPSPTFEWGRKGLINFSRFS